MDKKATPKKLTPKQIKAIESLLTEGDIKRAADDAGINRTTLYRWLREDSDFGQALKEAEAAALDNLSRRLVSLSDKAAGTLETILDDKDAGAGHRLRASDIVLSNLLKIKELYDLEQRINALEAAQNRGNNET